MFLPGVAEQFAIAEAKLRAWASVDDDDVEDFNNEESHANGQPLTSIQSSGSHGRRHFDHFHLIPLFIPASSLTECLIFPPPPPTIHPFIPRCSDFLLLPQTPPQPILSQDRHVSLKLMAVRLRPLTVPWAPAAAAAAAASSVVDLRLIMTHIHPRPIHLLYPATA